MRVEEFLEALDRVGSGGVALDPEVVRQLLSRTTHTDPLQKLTAREREVLATMAEGHNNTSIAQRLYITPSAVEKHANSIFDKLGLTHTRGYNRRIQAVVAYLTT
jgi:DNA-binding NarL/FixJ family response regulator